MWHTAFVLSPPGEFESAQPIFLLPGGFLAKVLAPQLPRFTASSLATGTRSAQTCGS